jgi:uncharacterized protein
VAKSEILFIVLGIKDQYKLNDFIRFVFMKASKRILITGASGLVGSRLTSLLLANGYQVAHLSRSKKGSVPTYVWDVDKQTIDNNALNGVDTIIHLAGANVAEKRWTESRKKEIIDSRVKSTELLFNELKSGNHAVKNFISASAIGYYGFQDPDKVFTEENPAGEDFLAQVTKMWEEVVDKISALQVRVVKVRIGVVLAKEGGALQSMAKPIKFLAGAPLGSGDQYVSWIHIDDLCGMFMHAIETPGLSGAINAVAPKPVTNRELTRAIAKYLHKPLILPSVPAFALRLALGEMASIVTKGSKISNQKISASGYRYKFDNLNQALKDLL